MTHPSLDPPMGQVHAENPNAFLEDVIKKDTKVYISIYSPFFRIVINFCIERGISCHPINTGMDVWYRDYFIKTKNYIYTAENSSHLMWPQGQQLNDDVFFKNKQLYNLYRSPNPVGNVRSCFLERQQIQECFGMRQVDHTCLPIQNELEGGNLITGINLDNDIKFVVGKSVIAATMYRKELYALESVADLEPVSFRHRTPYEDEHLNKEWKGIKNKIFNMLKHGILNHSPASKPVVFIPQWAYHIDLQMCYIGNGVFLVHSFLETVSFILEHTDEIIDSLANYFFEFDDEGHGELYEYYKEKALEQLGIPRMYASKNLIRPEWKKAFISENKQNIISGLLHLNHSHVIKYEEIVEKVIQKLKNHHFHVEKYCGLLPLGPFYNGTVEMDQRINVTFGRRKIIPPISYVFLYTNAIASYTRGRSELLIPCDRGLFPFAEEYIRNILAKYHCSPVFISGQDENQRTLSVLYYVSAKLGSLRCQINTNLDRYGH